jgi:aspartyl-tRNA(Asn)/glutamyl-tRNA(Gln) amidotransferase subunit B
MTKNKKFTPIIGLEVHVELETKSKMFCSCSANHFHIKPNSNICPVCLGLPGALPVPNEKAINWCLKIGLALNCKINQQSKFDRKNYFYPDLAKGYQISQYDLPFCYQGNLKVNNQKITITRVHMEEDTGKLIHKKLDGDKVTLVDFNRSGVPLVEIVSEPEINSANTAVAYLKKLRQIIRYLKVSSADLEKGSMRLEANISLKEQGKKELPDYKVEIKNLNSFKFVKKAINYEIKRQSDILDRGKQPTQETRGFNEDKETTFSQRTKEGAADYRYFPEPDIPPISISKEEIEKLENNLPILPQEKLHIYVHENGLNQYQANILIKKQKMGTYFDKFKTIVCKSNPDDAAEIIKEGAKIIINKKINLSKKTSEDLLNLILEKRDKPVMDRSKLISIIQKVVQEQEEAVKDFKNGKKSVIGFLVGKVMQKSNGKADPQRVKKLLKKNLSS